MGLSSALVVVSDDWVPQPLTVHVERSTVGLGTVGSMLGVAGSVGAEVAVGPSVAVTIVYCASGDAVTREYPTGLTIKSNMMATSICLIFWFLLRSFILTPAIQGDYAMQLTGNSQCSTLTENLPLSLCIPCPEEFESLLSSDINPVH